MQFIFICFQFLIVWELYLIMQNQCAIANILRDLEKGAKNSDGRE